MAVAQGCRYAAVYCRMGLCIAAQYSVHCGTLLFAVLYVLPGILSCDYYPRGPQP